MNVNLCTKNFIANCMLTLKKLISRFKVRLRLKNKQTKKHIYNLCKYKTATKQLYIYFEV